MNLRRRIKLAFWEFPGRGTARRLRHRIAGLGGPRVLGPDPYEGAVGPSSIVREEGEVFDEARGIGTRFQLSRPEHLQGKLPAIIFSPGRPFGRGRPAPPTEWLDNYLAVHGYIAITVWHTGADEFVMDGAPTDPTDKEALRAFMLQSNHDWDRADDRFRDLSFMIDVLSAWNEGEGALAGHIDLDRIGVSGYSFGARTALGLFGEKVGTQGRSYKDERIKTGIAYSPTPVWKQADLTEVFAEIDLPILHLSGTADRIWTEPILPEDRTAGFHAIAAPDQTLLVLRGADHVTFAGSRPKGDYDRYNEARHHQLIKSASLAFWDAYLREDEAAKTWCQGEFRVAVGRDGSVHLK